MGDGVGRVGGDLGVEPGQVAGDGRRLAAGRDRAGGLERQGVSAAGQVGAEDVKDRGAGQRGEVGPDREDPAGLAQQAARAGVRPVPGDVARQVHGLPRPQRRAAPQEPGDALRRVQAPAQEEPRLRLGLVAVEEGVERLGDVLRPLDHQPERQAAPVEPVEGRDVAAEVTADQHHAPPFGQRLGERLVARDVEQAERLGVVVGVEQVIPRQEPQDARGQGPGVGPVAVRAGSRQRLGEPPAPGRPERRRRPAQRLQRRVGPLRPQSPQRGEQPPVKGELPGEDLAGLHGASPCGRMADD